jgi:1,4-dihydroxy-6-naphthoate synthase
LLDAGSALGFGVGPLLVESRKLKVESSGAEERLTLKVESQSGQKHATDSQYAILNTQYARIGIPGKYTTANFLLSLAFPEAKNKVEMVFSDIERALLAGEIDLGLIIHENRFTYQDKGLHKVIDLGEFWEELTGCAIPLGGIMIKRSLPDEIKHKVNRIIRRSVEFAFANPKSGLEFISAHSQEMSEEVMYKHIDLYVNKYSIDLGAEGRKAVTTLFDEAIKRKVIPESKQNLFL